MPKYETADNPLFEKAVTRITKILGLSLILKNFFALLSRISSASRTRCTKQMLSLARRQIWWWGCHSWESKEQYTMKTRGWWKNLVWTSWYVIQGMICYTWSGPGGMWCCFFHTRRILSGWTWSPFLESIYHENLSNLFDYQLSFLKDSIMIMTIIMIVSSMIMTSLTARALSSIPCLMKASRSIFTWKETRRKKTMMPVMMLRIRSLHWAIQGSLLARWYFTQKI